MEKQIKFKHGVSVTGELQVHKITQYMAGDKVNHEVYDKPYSPSDIHKMGDFDAKSQQIIETLYVPEVIEEVQADIAHYAETFTMPGFQEFLRYDRIIDEFWRISIRQAADLIEGNRVISRRYLRSWIMPGGVFLDKDILSKTLAKKFHTPENIGLFQAAMQANSEAYEKGLNGEAVIK